MKLLFLLISFVLADFAFGQATEFDSSFGTNGVVVRTDNFRNSHGINDIAIQKDGKIVAVVLADADIVGIARYLQNGEPDLTFGNDGLVTYHVGYQTDEVKSLIIQPDGKILVFGNTERQYFFLIRYHEDGSLDNSFGTKGLVKIGFSNFTSATSFALQADGKIVIGGLAIFSGDTSKDKFCIARFNTNGQLDKTFNHSGVFFLSPLYPYEGGHIAIQADGKILMGGTTRNPWIINSPFRYCVFRVTPAGILDSTFYENGLRIGTESLNYEFIDYLSLQEDGKIIIGGPTRVRRLLNSGKLDSTFGLNGLVKLNMSSLSTMAIEPSGKIVCGGYTIKDQGPLHAFLWVRLTKDGQLDCSSVSNISQLHDDINSVLVQPDGKILVAGISNDNFAMARFMGDSISTFKGYEEYLFKSFVYPNPLSNEFTVEYNVVQEDVVTIKLTNLQGQLLITYLENTKHNPGNYRRYFSVPDNFANGIYFLYLESSNFKKKIRILKAG